MYMENSIISKGKTAKEAVTIALDLLGEKLDSVDIEIIKYESKGILGLGARPAVVRVTVKERARSSSVWDVPTTFSDFENMINSMELPEEAPHSPFLSVKQAKYPTEFDLLGKVWVKNNKIFCKDAPGKYPLITAKKDIKLYKNSELMNRTVVVNEKDVLEVDFQDEEREPSWELSISDDKMQVTLKVSPGVHISRKLKDKEPDHFIELEAEETRTPIFIETGPVMEKVREMGVVYGIDYTEIAYACRNTEEGSFIIAKGNPPIPGENGYFQPTQQVDIKKGLKERSDGTIDFREIQQFPSVERGQVLGIIHPPVQGIPGTTVTNEVVLPPDVFPLVVQEGKGITLVEDGSKVVATDAGHPEIKVKGMLAKISIIPKLMIGKDVDIQFGNVHYIGDVEVLGSVQDGMLVQAQGNVLVQKNVNMAKVSAGESMIIKKNIISSEVSAGNNSVLLAEIHQILGELIQQMHHMISAIQQLSTVSAFKVSSFTITGLGALIKILCDGKFKSFPPLTKSLINKIKSGKDMLDDEWMEFSDRLNKGFIMTHVSNFRSVEEVGLVIEKAEELFSNTLDEPDDNKCFIHAGFVHNSQLYSSGDIMIVGQGVYNSNLRAGGVIEIYGFLRGGEIYAAKGVKIQEAGTRGGMGTKITVPKGETIKIEKVMEDTVVQVGSKSHKFTVQSSHVFARLNDDGQLLIS